MKKSVLVFCFIFFVFEFAICQNFLNDSFEINTTTCQAYISNAAFNSFMTDVKAIGNLQMISIYDTTIGCGEAENGSYAINLMTLPDGITFDGVSLKLTDSLHVGDFYSLSFYQFDFAPQVLDSIVRKNCFSVVHGQWSFVSKTRHFQFSGRGVYCRNQNRRRSLQEKICEELNLHLHSIKKNYICRHFKISYGDIAQSVEQRTENPCVGGSIPPVTTRWIASKNIFFTSCGVRK